MRELVSGGLCRVYPDAVFDGRLRDLFGTAARFAAVRSGKSDRSVGPAPNVAHRAFTRWIARHSAPCAPLLIECEASS